MWANRGARFPEIGRRSGKTATETDTAGGAAARTIPLRRRRPSAARTAIQPHGATGRFARNRPPERASFPTRPCSNTNAQDAWFVGLVILPIDGVVCRDCRHALARAQRSDEHTSELLSLMLISYAVFCLKQNTERKSLIRRSHNVFS